MSAGRILILAWFLMIPSLIAAETLNVVSVKPSDFQEKYVDRPLISSASSLVGWQAGTASRTVASPSIVVSGIDKKMETLCLYIEFVTGGYSATARISNPRRGSIVQLKLPSTFFQKYSPVLDSDLALLVKASEKSRCDSTSVVLNAAWGSAAPEDATNVLLNLALGSTARVTLEGTREAFACQSLEQVFPEKPRLNRQRFNTICQVALPPACSPTSRYELVIDVGSIRRPPIVGLFRRTCQKQTG